MAKDIRSFHEIVLTPKRTLIICDIDDTLMKLDRTPEMCQAESIAFFPKASPEFQYTYGCNLWLAYRKSVSPQWTDCPGFADMIGRLSADSRLVFLTARSGGVSEYWTRRDFACLGLPYDESGVFYTGNLISKGEFIRRFIPLEGFEHVVFIDDLLGNLETVATIFPRIQCYRFCK